MCVVPHMFLGPPELNPNVLTNDMWGATHTPYPCLHQPKEHSKYM